MLEWLKTILGDTYTEDVDKKVSAEIGKEFVSRADFNTANEAKKTLDTTLKERDKQLEELKKVDPAALQAKITELQTANTTAQADFDKQLKQEKLNGKIAAALAGTTDPIGVRAHLKMDGITLDGDNVLGLKEQVEALKESHPFYFTEQPPTSTALPHGGSIETDMSDVEKAFIAKNPDVKLD